MKLVYRTHSASAFRTVTMASRIRKHKDLLKVLMKNNCKLNRAIIKDSDDDLIITLCEIIKNVLKGNVKISNHQKKRLQAKKTSLRKLASRGQSIKGKRRIIQSGGFLPLLAPLVGAVASLFFPK
jgi:hypothetical protein